MSIKKIIEEQERKFDEQFGRLGYFSLKTPKEIRRATEQFLKSSQQAILDEVKRVVKNGDGLQEDDYGFSFWYAEDLLQELTIKEDE